MMPTNLKGEIKNPDSLNELLSRKSSGRRQSLSGGLLMFLQIQLEVWIEECLLMI